MKRLLTLFGLLLASSLMAQGNLQFNQVRLLERSTVPVFNNVQVVHVAQDSFTLVVPAGKVLKIETAFANFQYTKSYGAISVPNFTDAYTSGVDISVSINTSMIFHSRGATSGNPPGFPLWLPEGSYTVRSIGVWQSISSLPSARLKTIISALEFDVAP